MKEGLVVKQMDSLEAYLQASEYIDFNHELIQTIATKFTQQNEVDKIKAVYEFVRDKINHSYDIHSSEVTRRASEVLLMQHGICYAKSHLLAALLRSMNVPSGICYQRLTLFDEPKDGYCIHALNTVYLREYNKWIRLDARGNKEGIHAQFSIEQEKLAFPIRTQFDEKNYMYNYAEPHPEIIQTLERYSDATEMYHGLPDKLDELN